MYAPARTAQLAATNPAEPQLSCLEPVDGLTWVRWADNQQPLDLWCHSVGRPVFEARPAATGDIVGVRILSWNVHVGAGRLELAPRLLEEAAAAQMGDPPAAKRFAPATLFPSPIQPRYRFRRRFVRGALRWTFGTSLKFGLSVAYVPSMRNGSATGLTERGGSRQRDPLAEPLTDVRAIELPFGKQRRVAVTALIASRGDRPPIRVVSTHFDTNGDRVAQATALSERLMLFTRATAGRR